MVIQAKTICISNTFGAIKNKLTEIFRHDIAAFSAHISAIQAAVSSLIAALSAHNSANDAADMPHISAIMRSYRSSRRHIRLSFIENQISFQKLFLPLGQQK